jgi:type I restriction enzyme S subunit
MSSEWVSKRLSEVIDLVIDNRGRNPNSYTFSGIPVIDNYLISGNWKVNLSDVKRYIDEGTYKEFLRKYIEPGDVLMTLVGNGYAQVALAPEDRCAIIQNTVGFRCDQDNDNQYLYYLLRCNRDVFMNLNRGAAQPSIKVGDVLNLEFEFPNKRTQIRVSTLLGALDDRITLLRETNATLEAIAQALFKSWFVDFDPVHAKAEGRQPEGMDAATAALFPDSFEESELGLVPKGWKLEALEDAYEINPTRKLIKGSVAPYLDMAGVGTKGHVVTGVIERELGSGTKFINGDTLLARITPCLENGKTAFVDFLDDEQVGWGSTEFVVLRPKPPLPAYHGYLLARHPAFRDHAIQSMSGTSGRQRVQNDVLGRYLITVPEKEVAGVLAEITENIQVKIAANQLQAQTLIQLRDTLLPRLISGQVRLPEAEALLENAL